MLGYPHSDASPGGRQPFQQGALAGHPVQLVTGAFLANWAQLGYETGAAEQVAGPTSAFQTFRGTSGTMQSFKGALILAASNKARSRSLL